MSEFGEPEPLDEPEFDEPPAEDFEGRDDISASRSADRFKHTTAGHMLGAAGLAIEKLLQVPREQAPIEVMAPGAPPGGRETEMDLDPEDPSASVVTFRPKH